MVGRRQEDTSAETAYERLFRATSSGSGKALILFREDRLRDLGGLALEMYKRDRFDAGLVVERCAEVVAVEAFAAGDRRAARRERAIRGSVSAICICGAPLLLGARFCATCGRPVGRLAA